MYRLGGVVPLGWGEGRFPKILLFIHSFSQNNIQLHHHQSHPTCDFATIMSFSTKKTVYFIRHGESESNAAMLVALDRYCIATATLRFRLL